MSSSEVYAEVEKRRRAVEVMELLTASRSAWDAGDQQRSRALMNQAIEVSPGVIAGIMGGWVIGEVPRPGTAEWIDYVHANAEALWDLEDRADAQ